MSAARTMTAVLGIDMETDLGSWTPGWEGVTRGTPGLLELLARRGVKATFYFTGEAAQAHPQVVADTAGAGHDVGCHSLYHETLGEELFPLPGVKPVLAEEVDIRVRKATTIVADLLGEAPRSFRAPRLWGSTHLVNLLETLGYTSDASYPLFYYGRRLAPYHPSRDDWREPGDLSILEIPNFADLAKESSDPLHRDRDQWPLFRTRGAAYLLKRIGEFVSLLEREGLPVVLCFYLHPWEFVPLRPVYRMNEATIRFAPWLVRNTGDKALRQLDLLVQGLLAMRFRFATARALAAGWSGGSR